MLRKIDKLYFRFVRAWLVFRDPELLDSEYNDGMEESYLITKAQILQALSEKSPHDFANDSFKLGYHYASEIVKGVSIYDEDNAMA